MTAELSGRATQAFVYGFPLVFNLDQVRRYITTGVGANPAAPLNSFGHSRALAGPEDRFVTINNDTIYSMAQIDVSAGPVLLEVPDTTGRYYVLQFVSAWTENFAYVGTRGTGSAAQRFLLVGPDWNGEDAVDAEATVIRFPTTIGSIVGRWAVADEADVAAVHQLQDAMTLTATAGAGIGLPNVDTDGLDEPLAFWERYRVCSQAFAPPARDRARQEGFAELGLTGATPVAELGADVQAALRAGHTAGMDGVQGALRGGHMESVNGWQVALHSFDYNLDHFEVGALDEPRWKMADTDERIIIRAAAALGGLWGNNGYEAAYFAVYVDETEQPLDGAHQYELTLDPPPPNDAFWSLTMYDVPDYFLTPNPIDRYSIGDRTPGIVTGPGGAITLSIGHRAPDDADRRANWLPAPEGRFRPILRVYLPGEEFLSGEYTMPPIRRVS